MAQEVNIVVAGLVLSVRGSGGVTFVLPNAELAHHAPHYAILGVPADAIKPSTLGTPVPAVDPEYLFWEISGCRLSPAALDPPFSPNNPKLRPEAAVNSGNIKSIARLASLQALSLGSLDDDLWDSNAQLGSSAKVRAVATLSGGHLEVCKLVPRAKNGHMPYQFFDTSNNEPPENPFRALAQQLLYHGSTTAVSWKLLDCARGSVEVDRDTSAKRPLLLLNIPDDVTPNASHFATFYDLLRNYTGPRYYPVPLSEYPLSEAKRTRPADLENADHSAPIGLLERLVEIFGPNYFASPSDPFCPGSQWP